MKQMIQKLTLKLWGNKSLVTISFKLLYPIVRIFQTPEKFLKPFVKEGYSVADIGCATGFFTIAFAELVGFEGKVYAVDMNEKSVRELEKKISKGDYSNIEPHASSADDLSFIDDGTIDFVFASGLL
ncbi:MAG: class I SAM-dependent methyltransferase [Dehalococcoidales bacterium]|nr:MAG: class I SAM-dependent methyltransferase [Dehalococcoidales bacterium]